MTRRAVVIVTSTRAAAGDYEDRTGPLIAAWLAEHSFEVAPVVVVADGPDVAAALTAAVASEADLVVTTGGTGIGAGDGTADATTAILDKQLPGFSEELRRRGAASTPFSLISRGVAGVAGSTFIVNLPGRPAEFAMVSSCWARSSITFSTSSLVETMGRASTSSLVETMGRVPVSSRAATVVEFARLSADPITLGECSSAVASSDAGAVVTFAGIVRDHDTGRAVTSLDYEAHPSAEGVLAAVAESVASEFPGIRIAIEHRTGSLDVGDLALACAVSSAHRAEAFAACSRLVDEVKRQVPIWKEQHFADGTTEWVGSL